MPFTSSAIHTRCTKGLAESRVNELSLQALRCNVSYQKQLPYSLRLFSAEWLTAVVAARPVAFVWYDFCVWLASVMARYCDKISGQDY